jgi:hypothetical protein
MSQIEVGLAEAKGPIGGDIARFLGLWNVRTSEHPQDLAACKARSFIAVASPRPR